MLTDAQWMRLEPLIEACRPKGKTPAPGSAAHALGHRLAPSERGQVARHPG
jgi:hypothetical protein